MSALTVNVKNPKCNSRHQGRDYLYVSPVNASDAALAPLQVASGPNLQQQLGVATGDLVRVTVAVSVAAGNSTDGDGAGWSEASYSPPPPDGSGEAPSGERRRSRRLGAAGASVRGSSTSTDGSGSSNTSLLDSHLTGADLTLLNLTLLAPGDTGKEVYNGSTLYVKSITYIISTCGWSESISPDALRAQWFNDTYGPKRLNLQDYHQLCTYGKVVWGPDNNLIVGPVQVPCSGNVQVTTTRWAAYNGASKCGLYEQMAWRAAGEAAARQLGYGPWIDAAKLAMGLRVITVLPAQVNCSWVGLASVGCAGRYCETYVKGTAAADLPTFFHELGHNQGLGHAGAHKDEYGDGSDVMGNAYNVANGYLCMNPANAYRVGWAAPAERLQVQDTPGGTYLTYTLPATGATDTNYLLLNLSSSEPGVPPYSYPDPYPNYYVALRSRTPTFDNILPSSLNNQIHITQYNGTARERDYNATWEMAHLRVGRSWASPLVETGPGEGAGFNLTVLYVEPGVAAGVVVCVFRTAYESGPEQCANGLDDDCDGLVDEADPSCSEAGQPSPPPPDLAPPPLEVWHASPPDTFTAPPPAFPPQPPQPPRLPPPPPGIPPAAAGPAATQPAAARAAAAEPPSSQSASTSTLAALSPAAAAPAAAPPAATAAAAPATTSSPPAAAATPAFASPTAAAATPTSSPPAAAVAYSEHRSSASDAAARTTQASPAALTSNAALAQAPQSPASIAASALAPASAAAAASAVAATASPAATLPAPFAASFATARASSLASSASPTAAAPALAPAAAASTAAAALTLTPAATLSTPSPITTLAHATSSTAAAQPAAASPAIPAAAASTQPAATQPQAPIAAASASTASLSTTTLTAPPAAAAATTPAAAATLTAAAPAAATAATFPAAAPATAPAAAATSQSSHWHGPPAPQPQAHARTTTRSVVPHRSPRAVSLRQRGLRRAA
ncbi:hypothetical protein HXX76_009064 [Chlamydomonas incerta]|uniref:Peptidase M11 gametolysin domain-containing protein n=1 Tax=Chlamydomonas incerta TaxID=51695 RepID=A0A835SY55_CHLIN|nr:hypothetical protein HXX76_009064 [Chlamydomonas incerta]|eukprot:KAG2432138.1 hypothetical protein HXX76_009064 [Chlamydomonas incerta]